MAKGEAAGKRCSMRTVRVVADETLGRVGIHDERWRLTQRFCPLCGSKAVWIQIGYPNEGGRNLICGSCKACFDLVNVIKDSEWPWIAAVSTAAKKSRGVRKRLPGSIMVDSPEGVDVVLAAL